MKKLVIAVACLAASMFSCAKDRSAPDTIVPPETVQCTDASCPLDAGNKETETSVSEQVIGTFLEDGWSFIVPPGWVKTLSEEPGVKVLLLNEERKNLIFFLQEDFSGSSEAYTLTAIKGLKETSSNIGSVKQITLNGINFVLVESTKSGARMWIWLTTRNGFGYGLACGGLDQSLEWNRTNCFNVASTLQIK